MDAVPTMLRPLIRTIDMVAIAFTGRSAAW